MMYVITKFNKKTKLLLYYTGFGWSTDRNEAAEYVSSISAAIRAFMVGGQVTIDPINFF
jgi:hypothetical protein